MSFGEQMIEALHANDLTEAQAYYDQALKEDSPDELYSLAETLYQLGFLDEAKEIYGKLLALFPEEEQLKVSLAEIALESDDLSEAMLLLDSIAKESEVYPQALLVQADLYQIQGLYEVSEQKLAEASELLPEEPVILFALAELLYTTGKYAQAIHQYKTLLEQGYEELSGVILPERIGSAYSALADFENALGYLEDALTLREDTNTLFELGFTNMQAENYKRAIEVFSKLKELDPSFTSIYPYLGRSLEEENQLEKAAEILEEGIRLDEFNPELFEYAGKVALKLYDEEKAESYFRQAVLLDPERAEAALELTNLLLKQERFEDAVEIALIAIENDEIDAQFYWNLAIAYEALELFEKAGEAYQQAYPRFSDNLDFLKAYGLFLREEGKLVEAEQVIRAYLMIEPSDDEMIELLSSISGEEL